MHLTTLQILSMLLRHINNQRITHAIGLPVLNLEWEDQLFPVASTAVADDLSRLGVFVNFDDLQRQFKIKNDSLDVTLASLGLAQNRAKQYILIISKNPEIYNNITELPDSFFKRSCQIQVKFLAATLSAKSDLQEEFHRRLQAADLA